MEDVKFILAASNDLVKSVLTNMFYTKFEEQKKELEIKLKIDLDLIDDKKEFLKKELSKLRQQILDDIGKFRFDDLKKQRGIYIFNSVIELNIEVIIKDFYFNNCFDSYLSPSHYEIHNNGNYKTYPIMNDKWNLQYHKRKQKEINQHDIYIGNAELKYKSSDDNQNDKFNIEYLGREIKAIPYKDLDFDDLEKYLIDNKCNYFYLVNFALYLYFVNEYNNLLSSDDLLELETGEKPNLKLSRQIIILNELGIIEYLKNKHPDIRPVSREIAKLLDDATEDSINPYITGILSDYKTAHNPYNSQNNKKLVKELKELFKKYSLQ